MKISELHQLIGRPAFNIGDRVQIIHSFCKIGWVSHINLDHGNKAYIYMIVNEDGGYINGTAMNSGFSIEEIKPDDGEAADVANGYPCRSLFMRKSGDGRPAVKVNMTYKKDFPEDVPVWVCWVLEDEWVIKGEFDLKDHDSAIMMAMSYRKK